jgi:hypothetical protein
MLEAQLIVWALALAFAKAGSSRAARMAMMAMTTSSSIRVKAEQERTGNELPSALGNLPHRAAPNGTPEALEFMIHVLNRYSDIPGESGA